MKLDKFKEWIEINCNNCKKSKHQSNCDIYTTLLESLLNNDFVLPYEISARLVYADSFSSPRGCNEFDPIEELNN